MRMIPTTSERLLEAIQTLPEPLVVEVLDFVQLLRARHTSTVSQPADINLASLCGGLENTKTFSEPPLVIQQKSRNEWR